MGAVKGRTRATHDPRDGMVFTSWSTLVGETLGVDPDAARLSALGGSTHAVLPNDRQSQNVGRTEG